MPWPNALHRRVCDRPFRTCKWLQIVRVNLLYCCTWNNQTGGETTSPDAVPAERDCEQSQPIESGRNEPQHESWSVHERRGMQLPGPHPPVLAVDGRPC